MKRPDVFVCMDGRNQEELGKDFEIATPTRLTYEAYWDSVIERVQESVWWNSPRPVDALGAEVWDARAAFLDAIYYDGKDMPGVPGSLQNDEIAGD
jgi:hypothetical protein